MIRHTFSAAGLLLAAGVMSALGGVASTDAMAAERAPMVRHDPKVNDPNPGSTPCGACYKTQLMRLYVSTETIGSATVVELELYSQYQGRSIYRGLLTPLGVDEKHVVYAVPQGPTEHVASGVIRWTSSQGQQLSKKVIVDNSVDPGTSNE
ncbi:hypothetical protein WMF30_18840 [Sorangium sp. So ce134]